MAYLEKVESGEWRTVSMRPTSVGLTARERFERFRIEAMTEIALRVVGILMVVGSIMLWFLVPMEDTTGRIASHSAVASMLAVTGLGVFFYGTRGFRRQLNLNVNEGTLSLTKININEQARVSRLIKIGEIDSVFLRRPATPGGAGHASGAYLGIVFAGHRAQRVHSGKSNRCITSFAK